VGQRDVGERNTSVVHSAKGRPRGGENLQKVGIKNVTDPTSSISEMMVNMPGIEIKLKGKKKSRVEEPT